MPQPVRHRLHLVQIVIHKVPNLPHQRIPGIHCPVAVRCQTVDITLDYIFPGFHIIDGLFD